MEHGKRYKYKSLSAPDKICLVGLLPGRNSEIDCSLREVSVDQAPAYEALSYTWGNEKPEVYIQCHDDKLLRVTINCLRA
jgi:hypothetical protein